MPLICYVPKSFQAETLTIIDQAVDICEHYAAMGYELTLRQLYYQFVARDLLPNSDRSYKRLGSIVNDARLAGLIDWDHLTDRTRTTRRVTTWHNPSDIIDASASQFRRDLWNVSNQDTRPRVLIEKDALVDIASRAANRWQVPYLSCRGYLSQSEMWSMAQAVKRQYDAGLEPVILHLGDHDPSGIDMTRDIEDRLQLFVGAPIEVNRIALNMDQIQQYNPPRNPAKLTDSRSTDYIRNFGHSSWELDALEPQMLVDLISDHIEDLITDRDAWDDAVDHDRDTRDRMQDVAQRWDDIYDRWGEIEYLLDS